MNQPTLNLFDLPEELTINGYKYKLVDPAEQLRRVKATQINAEHLITAKQYLTQAYKRDWQISVPREELIVFARMAKDEYKRTYHCYPPESNAHNTSGGGTVWYCEPTRITVLDTTYERFLNKGYPKNIIKNPVDDNPPF